MTTRLDAALQRHPAHAEGLRLLASRDPSPNLKYLDWSTRILVSGQALAPEIADVVERFHRFKGRPVSEERGSPRIHTDIYTYDASRFTGLRDNLHEIAQAQERKRREREQLYHIDEAIDADVVYDSDDLIVRHIKNKAASAHYGLSTKWCVAMLREHYFEDYETDNATFFFFERKAPRGDEHDKVALMLPRGKGATDCTGMGAFTALDNHMDVWHLAHLYGRRVFDIIERIYERSATYPDAPMFRVRTGTADAQQLTAAFQSVGALPFYDVHRTLDAIVCNDAAPAELLEEIERSARSIILAAWERRRNEGRARRSTPRKALDAARLAERDVRAAMVIHPNVSDEKRAALITILRRSRVSIPSIRRAYDPVRIDYSTPRGTRLRRGRLVRVRLQDRTPKALLRIAGVLERRAARMRAKAAKIEAETAAKAKRKKRP